MAKNSNYSTLLKICSTSGSGTFVTVAGVQKLTPPTLSNPMLNSTTLDSVVYNEQIPSNSVSISDIKTVVAMSGCSIDVFSGSLIAGTQSWFQIAFSNGKNWTVPGYVSELTPGEVDAKSFDLLVCDLLISPSGSLVIS
jgi:hypothetical protein